MDIHALIQHIHRQYKGRQQNEVAAALGVSAQYLNDVLRGRREPGEKILRPLGLERRVTYVKASDD